MKVLETRYGGLRYRSRTEARWAVFFDMVGIRHHYEPEGFELRVGYYRPDFWLTDLRMFFEVKGTEPTADEIAKCADLAHVTEADILISSGPPEEKFSLRWFDRTGQRDGLYVFALDKNPSAGFWLVGDNDDDNDRMHVGPANDNVSAHGPVFSGPIEAAYNEARNCRFQGEEQRRPFQLLHGAFGAPANDQFGFSRTA